MHSDYFGFHRFYGLSNQRELVGFQRLIVKRMLLQQVQALSQASLLAHAEHQLIRILLINLCLLGQARIFLHKQEWLRIILCPRLSYRPWWMEEQVVC